MSRQYDIWWFISSYRDIVVTPVPLTALCTPPVLVPDVVTELHTLRYHLVTLGLGGTLFTDVVLFLGPLGPVGRGGPGDGGQTPVLLVLAGLDCLRTFLRVPVLLVTHIALQAGDGAEEGLEEHQQRQGQDLHTADCESV